jgi:hypothetical protein
VYVGVGVRCIVSMISGNMCARTDRSIGLWAIVEEGETVRDVVCEVAPRRELSDV